MDQLLSLIDDQTLTAAELTAILADSDGAMTAESSLYDGGQITGLNRALTRATPLA